MDKLPITIEDLCPEEASFTLESTGKTYTIRAMNISDWSWLKQKYGAEGMIDVIEAKNFDETCKLIYRLLKTEDKEDFSATDCTFHDEETGEKTQGRIGGGKLLSEKINGVKEFVEIIKALTKSIGAGEILKKEAAKKKKIQDQMNQKDQKNQSLK